MKSFFAALLVIMGCLILGGAAFVVSGIYNVAADAPHWRVTFLLLEAVRDRSIAVHSEGINVPPLNNESLVTAGFPHFHDMCRLCHGAPGYQREEFAEGLYPNPPVLSSHDVQRENGDRELYWIIKNGLKMTGMPSFGKTHTEEQLWGIVAFLRRLPSLDPQTYQQMVEAISQGEDGGTHHPERETKPRNEAEGGEMREDLLAVNLPALPRGASRSDRSTGAMGVSFQDRNPKDSCHPYRPHASNSGLPGQAQRSQIDQSNLTLWGCHHNDVRFWCRSTITAAVVTALKTDPHAPVKDAIHPRPSGRGILACFGKIIRATE